MKPIAIETISDKATNSFVDAIQNLYLYSLRGLEVYLENIADLIKLFLSGGLTAVKDAFKMHTHSAYDGLNFMPVTQRLDDADFGVVQVPINFGICTEPLNLLTFRNSIINEYLISKANLSVDDLTAKINIYVSLQPTRNAVFGDNYSEQPIEQMVEAHQFIMESRSTFILHADRAEWQNISLLNRKVQLATHDLCASDEIIVPTYFLYYMRGQTGLFSQLFDSLFLTKSSRGQLKDFSGASMMNMAADYAKSELAIHSSVALKTVAVLNSYNLIITKHSELRSIVAQLSAIKDAKYIASNLLSVTKAVTSNWISLAPRLMNIAASGIGKYTSMQQKQKYERYLSNRNQHIIISYRTEDGNISHIPTSFTSFPFYSHSLLHKCRTSLFNKCIDFTTIKEVMTNFLDMPTVGYHDWFGACEAHLLTNYRKDFKYVVTPYIKTYDYDNVCRFTMKEWDNDVHADNIFNWQEDNFIYRGAFGVIVNQSWTVSGSATMNVEQAMCYRDTFNAWVRKHEPEDNKLSIVPSKTFETDNLRTLANYKAQLTDCDLACEITRMRGFISNESSACKNSLSNLQNLVDSKTVPDIDLALSLIDWPDDWNF